MFASIFISFPVLGPEDIYYNLENICRFYIQNFSWYTSNFKSFLKDFSIDMFPQIFSEKNYQISYVLILLIKNSSSYLFYFIYVFINISVYQLTVFLAFLSLSLKHFVLWSAPLNTMG